MSFSLIACIGKNNELGKNNDLIFHFKEDMAFFRETTKNHTVVMGYNTWLSLGEKPLPGRKNLILSHAKLKNLPKSAKQISDLKKFTQENKNSTEEIFIIGGASIYALFLPHASKLYLTEVDQEASDADVYFPNFDRKKYYSKILFKTSNFNIIKYTRPCF